MEYNFGVIAPSVHLEGKSLASLLSAPLPFSVLMNAWQYLPLSNNCNRHYLKLIAGLKKQVRPFCNKILTVQHK